MVTLLTYITPTHLIMLLSVLKTLTLLVILCLPMVPLESSTLVPDLCLARDLQEKLILLVEVDLDPWVTLELVLWDALDKPLLAIQ